MHWVDITSTHVQAHLILLFRLAGSHKVMNTPLKRPANNGKNNTVMYTLQNNPPNS